MRERPPTELAALLTRIGLADGQDLQSVEARVHRMAGDLPRFESVWIDALRQARILTHYQAAEIHAGRGDSLQVAGYILCQPVENIGYSTVYRAEDRQTRRIVRLALFSPPHNAAHLGTRLDGLIAVGKTISRPNGLIEAAGVDGARHWAASPWVDGTPLADFILHHGRVSPPAGLEIARAMLDALIGLERAGIVHGDIRVQSVMVADDGQVRLPHAGLREILRPHEGFSHQDLAPEACSALAPERVSEGRPPSVASDLFSCGCVWWHILCGRPPLGGGDCLARLRAAQAVAIDDLGQWAADVPEALAAAIRNCLQKDPQKRPASMANLAQRLGPARRQGRQAIARCLATAARPRAPWLRPTRAIAKRPARNNRLTAAALAVLAAIAVAWPVWVAYNSPRQIAAIAKPHDPLGARPLAVRIATAAERPTPDPASRRLSDAAVTPAGYSDAINPPRPTARTIDGHAARQPESLFHGPRKELRLPSDRSVLGGSLRFEPGQWVHAQGGRARLVVPPQGLAVQAERVAFENVDFVAEAPSDRQAGRDETSAALVRLLAAECDFTNCSFQSARGSPDLYAAIVWQFASAEIPATSALPAGRIRMKKCVFRRVSVGIESRSHAAVTVEIGNSLHLGPGPMIRLTHAPATDEPLRLDLAQVTLREAEALLQCNCRGLHDPAGEIDITADGCVFAPRADDALLTLESDTSPDRLLHEMKWTGQGSVIAGQAVFARWDRRVGPPQAIDDATISIAGLVRGEVRFAGRFDGQPANSQIVNCQAPLQDTDSAGAAVHGLPPDWNEK